MIPNMWNKKCSKPPTSLYFSLRKSSTHGGFSASMLVQKESGLTNTQPTTWGWLIEPNDDDFEDGVLALIYSTV